MTHPGRSPAPPAAAGRDPLARGLLLAALAVGLLRFVALGRWSLWLDEALTWADYHHGLDDGQIGNPLGYLLIGGFAELWSRLTGAPPDEAALRFVPAVCGWLTIPLTYWAFRIASGARVAAAAALVLAASSWHLYWSQTARFYTMQQLAGLVGAGLVLRGLWRGRPLLAVSGLVVTGLGALLHPSLALVPPALVAAAWAPGLARRDPAPGTRRVALALSGTAALALLAGLAWAVRVWSRYLKNKPEANPAHFVLTTGFYVTPLLATAALVGFVWALRRRDAFGLVAGTVAAGTVLAGLVASQLATMSAQYVFAVLPWIAALACLPLRAAEPAAGAAAAASGARVDGAERAEDAAPPGDTRRSDRAGRASPLARLAAGAPGSLAAGWLCLLVLPALADSALYFLLRHGDRARWREAYELVWNRRGPDDLILGMSAPVGEYYLAPRSTFLRGPTVVGWIDSWRAAARVPQDWPRHRQRTWYVVREEWLKGWASADREAFEAMLRDEARLVAHFPQWVSGRDQSLYVWVRD